MCKLAKVFSKVWLKHLFMSRTSEQPDLPTQPTRCSRNSSSNSTFQDLCSILQIISQFLANLEKYFCIHIESMINDSTSPPVLGFQHTLMYLLPICSILRNTVKEFKKKILILSTEQGFLKYMSVSQNTHTYAHTWSLSVLIMYKPVPDIFSGFLSSEIIFFLN